MIHDLNILEWCFVFSAAFITGVSKAGIKGISYLIVAFMALVFGAKTSTGLTLCLFLTGDFIAIYYYRRNVIKTHLFALLPWMVLGVLIAGFFGNNVNDQIFKIYFSVIVLVSVVLMLIKELSSNYTVKPKGYFAIIMGFFAGVATMIGNMAGAFSNLYFLSTRIPKDEFIGTTAVLFLIINLIKLPIHIFSWGTVNHESLMINLCLIPIVVIGFIIGFKLVKYFSNRFYRIFILAVTALSAIIILLK